MAAYFPSQKNPGPKHQARVVIYSIPCKDCDKHCIGETRQKFNTRLRKHQKAVEQKHPKKSTLVTLSHGSRLQNYVPAQVGKTDASYRLGKLTRVQKSTQPRRRHVPALRVQTLDSTRQELPVLPSSPAPDTIQFSGFPLD